MSNTNNRDKTRNISKRLYESEILTVLDVPDRVAVESPVRISIHGQAAVTIFHTPGQERELAAGFCLSEGLIRASDDLLDVSFSEENQEVSVFLSNASQEAVHDYFSVPKGHAFATSGCRSLLNVPERAVSSSEDRPIDATLIHACRLELEKRQTLFPATGSTHAAALFANDGEFLALAEDVGRHNAMDKAIGALLLDKRLQNAYLGYVSSRASFEMVRKAASAGLAVLACTSGPTDLAIQAAERSGLTLAAFVRPGRFSVYSGFHRILAPELSLK